MRLQQRRTKTPRIILLLVVALWSLPSVYATDGGIESLRETGKAFSTVAKSVSPSVVFIQTESKLSNQAISTLPSPFGHGSPFDDDLFKRFFGDSFQGLPRREPLPKGHRYTTSQGSGFVINVKEGLLSDKSYIMTNNHVVQGADNIRVKFSDGREYDAEISGRDPHSDIAVIAIKAKNLPVVKPGDSSKLEVGEWRTEQLDANSASYGVRGFASCGVKTQFSTGLRNICSRPRTASFLDGWRKGEHWHNRSRVLVHMEEPENAADSN